MKCPFCAEEIQNEAILCRFCGSVKENASWRPPAIPVRAGALSVKKSNTTMRTMRTTGAFFLASAIFEGMSLTSTIPLFGADRGGALAVIYHLLYVGLFLFMGMGLWRAKSWGYKLMFAGTIFYTLDKMLNLLDQPARKADLLRQLREYGVLDVMDPGSVLPMLNWLVVLFIACWWGFLLYLYLHRDYFKE